MKTKYSKSYLASIVSESISIRQVLKKIGLRPAGGNYKHIPLLIKFYNLDTSHFKYQSWRKDIKFGHRQDVQVYLQNPSPISITSSKLRMRLIEEKLFEPKCYSCHNTMWLNFSIPLELEHKDGNPSNNMLDNLTLLCPNCHALTSTYRGKNIKKRKII